jgi:hypothetical protein
MPPSKHQTQPLALLTPAAIWAAHVEGTPICLNTNHFKLLPNGTLEFTSSPCGHTIEECKLHCGGCSKSYPRKKDLAWREAYTAIRMKLQMMLQAAGFSLGEASTIAGLFAPRIPIPPNAKDFKSEAEFCAAWTTYTRQFATWTGHNTSLTKNDLEAITADGSEIFDHVVFLLRECGVMETKTFIIQTFGSAREGRSNVDKNTTAATIIAAAVANVVASKQAAATEEHAAAAYATAEMFVATALEIEAQVAAATHWCSMMGMVPVF